MNARSLPDLNAKVGQRESSEMIAKTAVQICNAKEEWIERVMREVLPEGVFRMAYDRRGTEADLAKRWRTVKKWLDSHDYRMEEHGINARLFHGAKLVSTFVVKLADK